MSEDITEETIKKRAKEFREKKKMEDPNNPLTKRTEELEEEAKLDKNIIDQLNIEKKEENYLDLGICKYGNEYYFYYGFSLNGKEAIILSNGKILRNTLEKIKTDDDKTRFVGYNEIKDIFSYNGYIGEIAPTIAKETLKKYYTKLSRNHLVNPKEVYKTIRDKILYYMDYSGEDEIADVQTCWIIATYCYPIFYWLAHLLFNAPSGSGKSKNANIVKELSFRGFDLGASAGVTPAQIFRTLESNRGTILIDEFETNDKFKDTQQLVYQILNASASRNSYVIRTEQINKKWRAFKFPIFCPKICCNISGINPTSLSRFIAFKWLKTKSIKGKRKPERQKDLESFKPIREDLYILILENWKKIKEIYETLDIDLSNREEDNWLPLFAVAKFIDDCEGDNVNATVQLKKYLDNYKELEIETNDNTQEFFNILYSKVNEEQKFYTPKEIGNFEEIKELYSYLKSPAHIVGKLLKLYKFKSNRSGGSKKYLLSKELVKNIMDIYFSTELITHNNTNNTQSHKQHITTQEGVVLGGVCGIIQKLNSCSNEEPKITEERVTNE